MTYAQLIAKALKGRSVNSAAKDWGIPQPTLDKYVRGVSLPDYQTALKIADEAGIEAGEVMRILARQEAQKKPRRFFAEIGYAAAAFVVSVNLFLTPDQVNANEIKSLDRGDVGQSLYYVKYRCCRSGTRKGSNQDSIFSAGETGMRAQ